MTRCRLEHAANWRPTLRRFLDQRDPRASDLMQIPDALPTSTPLPDRDDRLSAVVGSLSELRSLSEFENDA